MRLMTLHLTGASLLILLIVACEDMVWDNPGDPNADIDPEDWKPTNLQAQVLDDSRINLTWDQEEPRIDGFQIYRSLDSSSWELIVEVPYDTLFYTDTGLSYGTSYFYRIRAFADDNSSSFVYSHAIITIFLSPTDLTALALDDSKVQISWTDNCSFEDGFHIYRQDDGGGWNQVANVNTDVVEYLDIGLTGDVLYAYRVQAYTENNNSPYSLTVYAYTGTTITDIDGNEYDVVQIGSQVWMAENLNVTHYRNGEPIPCINNYIDWENTNLGAYCYYDSSSQFADIYGALYNWHTVNDSRKIAPEGWHIPTEMEWQKLLDYFGGVDFAGGKLKDTGLSLWETPNTGATNESGFTARPNGWRYASVDEFYNVGQKATFWSNSIEDHIGGSPIGVVLNFNSLDVIFPRVFGFNDGIGIRCIRD